MSYEHAAFMNELHARVRTIALATIPEISDDDIAAALNMAESFGHIVDPTKYRDALYDGRLDRQRRLIKLFEHIRAEVRALYPNDPILQALTAVHS